jgi:hypothetical protein
MLAQQFEPVPAASWQIGALRGAKVRPQKRPPPSRAAERGRKRGKDRERLREEREMYNKSSPLLHPIVGGNPTTLASLGS